MAKLNPNKEEAIRFIKKYKGRMTEKEIVKLASKKFNYAESTIRNMLYACNVGTTKEKSTLRQQLEMIEKKHQEAYERRMEMAVRNRPKIRIDMGLGR